MMSHSKIILFNWRGYTGLYKRSSDTYVSFNKINMVSQNSYPLVIYYWGHHKEVKAESKAVAASMSTEVLAAGIDD